MKGAPHTNARGGQSLAADPVYLENTLLRIFGVLFCHDPKRARQRTGVISVHKDRSEKTIAVRLDPEYAQPGPFAHKVAMAVLRKQSRYGPPARSRVSFSQRELLRLTGRTSWGGRQSEELALALKQIRYTHVLAHFRVGDRFREHDFSIFNEVLIERRHLHSDPIVACTVVLADPIIQSLNDKHFTCLNHARMEGLSTISQALYMRLFFHFATMFDGHHRQRVIFRKRYDDICLEWLGGLTVLKHRSKIIGEQLGVHLNGLVTTGLLQSYNLTPAERRDGFVLTFLPGHAFFADYQHFYANRFFRGDVQFRLFDDNQSIGEPLQVAYLFAEKRTGKKRESIPYVSSREVATAKDLLTRVSFSEMTDFFDYALSEARKTRFDVQTLGGVKQYVEGYLHTKQRRAAAGASAATKKAHEREAAARTAYDVYLRTEADRLFVSLSLKQQKEIEALARGRAVPSGRKAGPLDKFLVTVQRRKLLVQRYPKEILSFEKWCVHRRVV